MSQRNSHGFTLIELVTVMIIIGIIAIAVMPRFVGREMFDSRGFFDQTKATIRYAQKAAVAQHREVFVNVTANAICLTYVADAACANNNAADIVLNPATGQRFFAAAPSGVTFNTVGSFSFSSLGRPSAAQAIGVVGDGMARSITVESETGYVHE